MVRDVRIQVKQGQIPWPYTILYYFVLRQKIYLKGQ
jgi:hypothetical protein